MADLGTLQRMSKLVGSGISRELALSSEPMNAERALQVQFINRMYDDKDALLAGARQLARSINANSPLVVQGTKLIINFSEEHTLDEGLLHVALWNSAFLHSDDLIEAVSAHLQKRTPLFRNRL